jgi:hypothetical protein
MQQLAELALAQLERLPPQVLPVQLNQVECVEEDALTLSLEDKVVTFAGGARFRGIVARAWVSGHSRTYWHHG